MALSYLGPGLGISTLVIVGLILVLVLLSLGLIIWIPLKQAVQKLLRKIIK